MITKFLLSVGLTTFFVTFSFAQKGIDTQTQKIRDETERTTPRGTGPTRSFDWGKDKTQLRLRVANPYQLNSRRDVLVETIVGILTENKIIVDETSSRLSEGIIVTEPVVFGKGNVLAEKALRRYGVLADDDYAWSRGRYSLTIEVQPIDGIKNNVLVNAKVEGRAGNGILTEWKTLPSSGLAEEEFLVKLIEQITGTPPEGISN